MERKQTHNQRSQADKRRTIERTRARQEKHEPVRIEERIEHDIRLTPDEEQIELWEQDLAAWQRVRDEMLQDLEARYPEAFSADHQPAGFAEWGTLLDPEVAKLDFLRRLKERGIDVAALKIEVREDSYVEMPAPDVSFLGIDDLPAGYGVEGGGARAVLLRALGLDPNATARDLDLIRTLPQEAAPHLDKQLSAQYMPDDFRHGYGLEEAPDVDEYMNRRDFTVNQVYVVDGKIVMTQQCLEDTLDQVIRLTPFEIAKHDVATGKATEERGGLKPLMKMLRLQVQWRRRFGEAHLRGIRPHEYELRKIKPFYIALQLEKAWEVGEDIANAYVASLVARKVLPEDIATPGEAAAFLERNLHEFSFRKVPVSSYMTAEDTALQFANEAERRFKDGQTHDHWEQLYDPDSRPVFEGNKYRKVS